MRNIMNNLNMNWNSTRLGCLAAAVLLTVLAPLAPSARGEEAEDWKTKAVSPVANPLFFEDPHVRNEIRPIFAYHRIGDDLLDGAGLKGVSEGDARYYALQLRWAVTDRLAIIATKDGYIQTDFKNVPSLSESGWADIAAGVKYAVIKDDENQFILTPGVKIEFPTGNTDVFQGNGDGEWDLFVSSAKSWDNFRVLGSAGVRIPNNFSEETASAHYSLQLDYYTCRWFIPFVTASGMTVLSEADELPLEVEGFDLINFGSSNASGFTQIVGGVGFRSRLLKWADLGFAYEKSLTTPKGLFDDRFTVDLVFHF
jgi:hypothetical protein